MPLWNSACHVCLTPSVGAREHSLVRPAGHDDHLDLHDMAVVSVHPPDSYQIEDAWCRLVQVALQSSGCVPSELQKGLQ